MIDETRARELAENALPEHHVTLGPARELREGCFFPFVGGTSVGSQGVIVNKETLPPLSAWRSRRVGRMWRERPHLPGSGTQSERD